MQVKNVRPGFKWGLWPGLINAAFEVRVFPLIFGGPAWQIPHNFPDHAMTLAASQCKRIEYPRWAVSDQALIESDQCLSCHIQLRSLVARACPLQKLVCDDTDCDLISVACPWSGGSSTNAEPMNRNHGMDLISDTMCAWVFYLHNTWNSKDSWVVRSWTKLRTNLSCSLQASCQVACQLKTGWHVHRGCCLTVHSIWICGYCVLCVADVFNTACCRVSLQASGQSSSWSDTSSSCSAYFSFLACQPQWRTASSSVSHASSSPEPSVPLLPTHGRDRFLRCSVNAPHAHNTVDKLID